MNTGAPVIETVPETEAELRAQVDELSGRLAAAMGRPRHVAENIVLRTLHDLVDDALRHQRVRPEAERNASRRLKREIAHARRGRWRNHPGRRRH